jgi:regulatory protein
MKRFPARADAARETGQPRREESDSPPRLRIESARQGASGTTIVVAGGSSYIFRSSQAEELGLSSDPLFPGAELEETDAGILAVAAEAYEAEKRAIALLARAEQSAYMLGAKLETRGLSKKAVRVALDRLSSDGVLSDRRYAEAYAASRLSRRAEGPASLLSSLRGRGIDGETAKAAIAAVLGPAERLPALAKAAEKEMRRSGGDREAARRRLRRLGFKSDEISAYFEKD